MAMVIVGDISVIKERLEALQVGEVVIYEEKETKKEAG